MPLRIWKPLEMDGNVQKYEEPLVGYRWWRAALNVEPRTEGAYLLSVYRAVWWPVGEEMRSQRSDFYGSSIIPKHFTPKDSAPGKYVTGGCWGIYSWRSPEFLASDFPKDKNPKSLKLVCGEVNIWGEVAIHNSRGYRSQFAYPKTIYLIPEVVDGLETPDRARTLARAYGAETKEVTELWNWVPRQSA